MNRKTTIKDIAAKAGVGIGTVSRVLNNNPKVSEKTRQKVLQIAKEMNYVPNGAARMLVRRSSSVATVGLLLPVVENQFFFELIKFIHTRLKQEQFNIMIFNTDHGQDSVIHHIVEQQLAGVLTLGDPPLTQMEREILEFHKVPFLYVDYHEEDANYVTYDSTAGSHMAADYLISRDCKKIMMIGLIDRSQQQVDRFNGFRRKMEEQGGVQVSELCIENEEESYEITRTLLKDRSIDGFFYFSDTMAYGGIQARLESDAEVFIIGYDDIFPSKYMKLSTIRQSSSILGTAAAEIIIELVKSRNGTGTVPLIQRTLIPELVDRQS